jgi:hypothetical protein
MKYGALPIVIDRDLIVDCKEMLFYQDMPIKLTGETKPKIENRLSCFSNLIGTACCDFIAKNGLDTFVNGYVYFTAKKMYQVHGSSSIVWDITLMVLDRMISPTYGVMHLQPYSMIRTLMFRKMILFP